MRLYIMNAFPGGSKKRVSKAGKCIREKCESLEDLQILEDWRAAHRQVLNTFQALLRNRTKSLKVPVAQRHKRKSTIIHKLNRYPKMQLARMDDVAGCRLIFKSIDDLYSFREKFHQARFKHVLRNDIDKYDYIKNPKQTGYRGVHDVYVYDIKSEINKHLKGLYVEVQYRTRVQHAWGTAVEVIGFITESQPKFEEGDTRYRDTMVLASELLARAFEDRKGPLPDLSSENLVKQFLAMDEELGMLKMLRNLNAANADVSNNKNTILMFSKEGELQTHSYKSAPEALRSLFDLESKFPDHDIVLVRADSAEEVRIAFKNYYSDATDFIELIDEACSKLFKA